MGTELKTLTINTEKLSEMVAFFSALGIPMVGVKVRQGTEVYRGKLGELEIQLAAIPQKVRLPVPDLSLRVFTEEIEAVCQRIRTLPGIEIVMDIQELPQGKMAIVLDPDGHSFEIVSNE